MTKKEDQENKKTLRTKEKDFVEIEYAGYLDDNTLFDTNIKELAEENFQDTNNDLYKPLKLQIGSKTVIEGLDEELKNKEINKEYTIEIEPERGYGKRNKDLIRLIPLRKFKETNINPVPGMSVQVNGMYGTVKSVNGGRVLVDLNHPLAGRRLRYSFKILRTIDDLKEKIIIVLNNLIGIETKEKDISINNGNIEIKITEKLNQGIIDELKKELVKRIDELKDMKIEIIPETKEITEKKENEIKIEKE